MNRDGLMNGLILSVAALVLSVVLGILFVLRAMSGFRGADILILFSISAVMSGFLWDDGHSSRPRGRWRALLFGSKGRSLLTGHCILWSGWVLWTIVEEEPLVFRVLLFLMLEAMFVAFTVPLFLNWHIGPFSAGARHMLDIWRIEDMLRRTGVLDQSRLRWAIESLLYETKAGNKKSRAVLVELTNRQDEMGRAALTIAEELDPHRA